MRKLLLPAAAALLAATIAAFAANNTFFTSIGDQVFPFTAPTTNPAAAGTIDNMTIGATTPAPVSATTLSATGAVSGAGFTTRLAAPGPIGNTTPSTIASTVSTSAQFVTSAGLPTIASGACGATTNGAVVAGSTNQAGSITIGSASTTTCTISWSATLGSAPKACVFMAMNAAAIAATTLPFTDAPSTTGVVFHGAVLASTNWSFICL